MQLFNFKKLFFVTLLVLTTNACDHAAQNDSAIQDTAAEIAEFRVTSVNNLDFLINDTDRGADVFFESDKLHSCQLYFVKAKFVQGYSVRAKHDPINLTTNPNIDLTCSIENDHFSLAGSKANYIEMSVPKVGDTAEIKLSFALTNVSGKKKFERKNVILHLDKGQTRSML